MVFGLFGCFVSVHGIPPFVSDPRLRSIGKLSAQFRPLSTTNLGFGHKKTLEPIRILGVFCEVRAAPPP